MDEGLEREVEDGGKGDSRILESEILTKFRRSYFGDGTCIPERALNVRYGFVTDKILPYGESQD